MALYNFWVYTFLLSSINVFREAGEQQGACMFVKLYDSFHRELCSEQMFSAKHLSRHLSRLYTIIAYVPRHDKTNKVTVRPVKTQISRPVRIKKAWVLSYLLSAQRRLIRLGGCWRPVTLLVLSCSGSYVPSALA